MSTPSHAAPAPLRVVVIGAGYFSQFHLEGWRAVAGAQVVALCDTHRPRAEALATRFGIANVSTQARELLPAVQPHIIDITVPPASQGAVVAESLPHSALVICQKPFGLDLAEAESLADLADRMNKPLVVHENFRFMPWFREARRLIDNGTLGRLHGVSFRLRPGDGQGPNAYLDRQPYFQTMPRLLVLETAIHLIDSFRYLCGDVTAVYARLRRLNPVIAGEDAGLIVFEFAGGASGLFDGNRLNDHVARNPRRTMGEMWLEGAAGVLRLDGEARLWFKPHQGDEREHAYDRGRADGFGGGACANLQRHVVAHLRSGTPLENQARDYLTNLRIREAVYRSHDTGQRIELPTAAAATACAA